MSSPIKNILYIACGNGLSENLGGSFIRTVEIAKRIAEEGVSIFFLTTPGGYKAANSKGLKATYFILPASIRGKQKETWLGDRAVSYVVSSLASFSRIGDVPEVNIIYTDSDYFCDVIPAIIYKKRYPKSKWCGMIHHLMGINRNSLQSYLISTISHILQKRCWQSMAKRADAIMVYDTEMGDSIKDYFIKEFRFERNQIYQVTNGIDTNVITNLQNGEKQYEAAMIGGLRPNKGLYDIIPIWEKVVAAMNHAKLVIVGGSSYVEWFEQEIKNCGLASNIILLGNRPHKEALSIMKRARIYITPSREEGWGIAICEALASKLPVVAYDLPVYKRTFADSLIRVPFGDITKFAGQVTDILANRLDCSKYILMGFDLATEYDWDKVAKRELDIYYAISSSFQTASSQVKATA